MAEARWFDNPVYERLALDEARTRARRERERQVFATERNAQHLAQLSSMYPTLTSGPLTAAAVAGIDPGDPGLADMALRATMLDAQNIDALRHQRIQSAQPPSAGFLSGAYDLFKGSVRTLTLGFEFLWEEMVQRNIRTMVGVGQGMSWTEAHGLAGASNALRAFQAWQAGDRVNVGTGFFAQSELAPETQRLLQMGVDPRIAAANEEQAQIGDPITLIQRQQRETGITLTSPGGAKVPVSPGRLLAINFVEPGTTGFNVLSGFTDLAANVFLDPANYALFGLSKMRKASRAIIPHGQRKTWLGREWDTALSAPDGQELIGAMTRMNERQIFGTLKQTQANPPWQMVKELTDAAATGSHFNVRQALTNLHESGRLVNAGNLLPRHTMAGRLVRGGGSLTGKPIASAVGRFGVPAAVQAGIGAGVGAATSQLTGQDPLKSAAVGAGLGFVSGRTATRIPGAGDLGAFAGRQGGLGYAIKHNVNQADSYLGYLMSKVGARGINPARDPDGALDDLMQHMALMRLGGDDQNRILRQALATLAETSDRGATGMVGLVPGGAEELGKLGLYGVVREIYSTFERKLIAEGMEPSAAKAATRLYSKEWPEFRAYWINQARQEQYAPNSLVRTTIGGETITAPMATLFSQMMDQWIPLLDPREIRRLGRRSRVVSLVGERAYDDWGKHVQALNRLGDFTMNKIWKPLVLLRIAWPVRVIGEEQLRLAFSGHASIVRHPIQYLSMVMADPHIRGRKIPGTGPAKEGLIPGQAFVDMDDHAAAMSRRNPETYTGIIHSQKPPPTQYGVSEYGRATFWPDMVEDVGRHARDPISNAVAQAALDALDAGVPIHRSTRFLDEVKESFANGELSTLRMQMIADVPRFSTLSTRTGSDTYIDINVWARMASLDGGNYYIRQTGGILDTPAVRGSSQRAGVEVAGQQVHSTDKWLNARGLEVDPEELIPFLESEPGTVARLRGGDPIPSIEARRLAGLTQDEFVDIFGRLDPMDNFRPLPVPEAWSNLPDGIYRMPGHRVTANRRPLDPKVDIREGQWGSVIVIRRGNVVGQLTYEMGPENAIRQIGQFASTPAAHPLGYNRDAWNMVTRLLGEQKPTHESLLALTLSDIGGTPTTVERWLRGQGIRTENLKTPEAIIDSLREATGNIRAAGVTAPAGADLMTGQGARAYHTRLQRAADGTMTPKHMNIDQWPAPHPMALIPEASDVVSRELLETIANRGMWRGRSLYQDIPREGLSPQRAALRPGRKGAKAEMRRVSGEFAEAFDSPRMENKYFPRGIEPDPDQIRLWDKGIDYMFDIMMGVPTDRLSRSPAFQQYYWKRVSQLLPYMSEEDVGTAIARMKAQGVTRRSVGEWANDLLRGSDKELSQLTRMAGEGFNYRAGIAPSGRITLAEADQLAKSLAMSEAKNLLYDISRKHNIFDMGRHFAPFGEAWLEIVTRWSKIIRDNPRVLRRLNQTIESGRRAGFFYNDPNTGEEVFNYPGSSLISNWMFGDPEAVKFTGRLAGVNLMIGQYLPGFGPVVQVPASVLGRDFLENPENQFWRELLLPFGAFEIESPGDIVDSLTPPWIRRFITAQFKGITGDEQRVFNNTVMDVMRILDGQGKVDLTTPDGWESAFAEAESKARMLYRVRAATALAGPTPAMVRFDQRDRQGRLWTFAQLSTEYRRLVEENEGSEYHGLLAFVEMFGLDPTLYATPKTRSIQRRATTFTGSLFEARNPDLFRTHSLTAYYARPDDADEDFNYDAYIRQLREGTREAMTPEQWAEQRNEFLGRLAYEHARRQVNDRKDRAAREWLYEYRIMLMERYPGFGSPTLGLPARANRESVIREFETWRGHEGLASSEAGVGVIQYLDARQAAIDELRAMGFMPEALRTSNRGLIYRDWLRMVGAELAIRYPSFAAAWVEVFSREIEETALTEPQPVEVIPGVGFDV